MCSGAPCQALVNEPPPAALLLLLLTPSGGDTGAVINCQQVIKTQWCSGEPQPHNDAQSSMQPPVQGMGKLKRGEEECSQIWLPLYLFWVLQAGFLQETVTSSFSSSLSLSNSSERLRAGNRLCYYSKEARISAVAIETGCSLKRHWQVAREPGLFIQEYPSLLHLLMLQLTLGDAQPRGRRGFTPPSCSLPLGYPRSGMLLSILL